MGYNLNGQSHWNDNGWESAIIGFTRYTVRFCYCFDLVRKCCPNHIDHGPRFMVLYGLN